MEDLQDKIIELMDLFDDEQVTTADKIDRPQRALDREAIDDFMKRNPMAGGGMLVQPGFGGTRQGYADEKDFFVYKNQFGETKVKRPKGKITLKELSQLDLPVPEATLGQVFSTKDRAKLYKKIFKDNGIKVVGKGPKGELLFNTPTKKQIDGIWKDTINTVQTGKQRTVPQKMYKPFQEEVLKIFNELSQTDTPFSTSDIYYKLVENVQDNPRIFLPKKYKKGTRVPGDPIKTALGKEKAALLIDGNLQRIEKTVGNRKKLVDILSKGKSDIDTLSKTLGISKKNLFAEANLLFDDIYRYTSAKVRKTGFGEKYGYLKDLDIKDYKNLLNNLRGSGFEKLDERSLRALITDAYAETNPKKYSAAISKLGEYSRLNNQLKERFGFAFQLDHPLSFQALKDLKNVNPENLLRVNPIPENINKIKIRLDSEYKNILREIRKGNTSPELLNQKQALESLSTKLGVGEFKIDNTGRKVLSFGADPFLKTNLPEKMGQNIFLQDRIAKNLKNIEPKLFTDALGKKSKFIKSIQNLQPMKPQKVKGLISFMKELGIKCQLSNGVNCMDPRAYQKSLNELSEKATQGDQAAKTTLSKFGNKVATAGRFIKGALGPLAIATEIALEGGIALNKTLNEGVPIKQAFADSLTNKYLLGPKLQIDKEAEIAKEMAKGEEFAMAKRGERMFLPQSATADAQRLKKREEEMKALYPQLDMVNLSNKEIDTMLADKGVYSPFTLGFGMQQRQPGIGDMRYNEDAAYDEIRDIINKGAEEDIRRQQMENLMGGAANFEKGGRAGFSKGSLRKGVLSLIDDSLKKTPKDTTTELDKLIKKTLDEDLFDKKDRIIDQINISEAKKRKNYPYNMRVFEEPKNLEFYDAITKSNFRTKTGPYYDRIRRLNKAGGGILKEAGDSSGAPPESGPNSQGLQGLLNRVKKI